MGDFRVVEQGEGLSSIAFECGFAPLTVWNHPSNETLRNRKDMNILLPGDSVYIPDLVPKIHTCALDQRHIFRMPSVPVKFRLQVFFEEKKVSAAPYRLLVDNVLKTGVTDGDGLLEQFIPAQSKTGLLLVELPSPSLPLVYRIDIGQLDPVDANDGVVKRLRNLGYYRPTIGQTVRRATWDAVRRFQRDCGLPMTGVPDAKTAAKLQQLQDTSEAIPQAPSTNQGASHGD